MSYIPTKRSRFADSSSDEDRSSTSDSEDNQSFFHKIRYKRIPSADETLRRRERKEKRDKKKKELIEEYLLTKRELETNSYPRPTWNRGQCYILPYKHFNDSPRKKCLRCGVGFVLSSDGEFGKENDVCIYDQGTCQNHVHKDNLDDPTGYLELSVSSDEEEEMLQEIYALDCEMCHTVRGLELIRVSVVDFDCKLVYDTLVKPFGKIVDYNTKWSGVEEKDMINITTNLTDVQNEFSKRFSADTIFVGHSLEHDMKALRIIHSSIIDTAILFPHRRGLPYKRALRNLVKDHLGLTIQQNGGTTGHDSTEDANACIKLLKWKLRRDIRSQTTCRYIFKI